MCGSIRPLKNKLFTYEMREERKLTVFFEAILCSIGLMVFSFFIQYKFPVRLISFSALLISAIIIARNLRSLADLKRITGENISLKITLLYTIFGIVPGIVLAICYRRYLGISLFPESLHLFVIVAALIGCMEELVFRGFLQGHVECINGPFSILFGTLSHTVYKCCLFLSPVITADVDLRILSFYTFMAGLLFGTARYLSKSILPALSAHALFDILVYAGYTDAPWWVW
jgi:membrane protease YdiL (CAAX protease family)